jgi:hypothetical protein
MSLRRLTFLIAALALALVAAAPAASAAEQQERLTVLSAELSERLGERGAGTWIDPATGTLVVNVVDDAAAAQVRAAGAKAHRVAHSLAALEGAQAALDPALAPDGLAWGVDVPTNTLVISVPEGMAGEQLDAFVAAAGALGVPVRVESVPAAPAPQAFYGGEAILAQGGGRCSAGFITRAASGNWYVLTAGHCTEIGGTWSGDGQTIGASAATNFPGDDFGAIRINNPTALDPRGEVLNYGSPRDISSAGRVPVGGSVCKTGSTTGTTCGTVQRYNVTVNYGGGDVVYGLTQTNVCTQPGDSGGPLYSGNSAQGITSGGTAAGCNVSGFQSFFQPADEALQRYGLRLQ